jgi:predicted O-linked N-acetylglucosamine transferase (SPINDLY family)
LYHGINDKVLLAEYGRICVRLLAHIQNRVLVPQSRNDQINAGASANSDTYCKPRPLRFGVVSSHIRSHAIWQDKIKGLYQCKPDDVDIYTFAIESQEDADTHYAQAHSIYFELGGWRLEDWVDKIAAQNLDIIYYPEVGLSAQVFRLACLRLAPVQMSSWGNPLTTGLPTIDHFVSAKVFEDVDPEPFYTEQLHLLEGFPSYYERYQGGDDAFDGSEFGLDFSKKLLLCAGTAFKYQFDFAEHYANIAEENDGVQMVFFAYDQEMFARVKRSLQDVFSARAIDKNKLVFMPWLSRAQYQYLMRKSYLLLDSLGFSGINTVLQALEVELPVVTMRGEMLRGRLGSGVLDAVGMGSWVAHSQQEYADWVRRLVNEAALREQYQAQLREVAPQMFENRAAADEFYAIVRKLCV